MNNNLNIEINKTSKICLLIIILTIGININIKNVFGQKQNNSTNKTVSEKQYKPELVVQTGHSEQIESITYSPDGKYIASGGKREVKLWDVKTGKELRVFKGNSGEVISVAFSPDGKFLASIDIGDRENESVYGYAIVWDITSGKIKRKFEVEHNAMRPAGGKIVFTPDGKWLAAIDINGLHIWDIESGSPVNKFEGTNEEDIDDVSDGFSKDMYSLAISPDGKYLVAGNKKNIEIWNTGTGKKIKSLATRAETAKEFAFSDKGISQLEFSPDGRFLAGSYSRNITEDSIKHEIGLWDVKNWKLLKTFEEDILPLSITFSSEGNLLANVSTDNSGTSVIKIRDVEQDKIIQTIKTPSEKFGQTFGLIDFSPNGKKLVSSYFRFGATVGVIAADLSIWSISDGKESQVLKSQIPESTSVVFSPDGKYLIGYGALDGSMKLWDLSNGLNGKNLESHSKPVNSVVFSPDGTKMADVSWHAVIRLWDLRAGKLIKILKETEYFDTIVFSPDSKFLIGNGSRESGDSGLFYWDAATGNEIGKVKTVIAANKIAFSPDGKSFIIGGEKLDEDSGGADLEIKDGFDGKVLKEISFQKIHERLGIIGTWTIDSISISPDNKFVALLLWDMESSGVPDNRYISLWNIETGKEVNTWEVGTLYQGGIAFSSDGKFLLEKDEKGINLWDGKTGKAVKYEKLPASANVNLGSSAITKLGETLIEAVTDGGKILLYDTNTKKEIASLISLNENDWAIVTPEGLFDATENAQKLMHFVVSDEQIGFEIIELEQLKSNYYVPNLFEKLLKGEKFSKVNDLTVSLSPSVAVEYSKKDLSTLNVKLKNRGGGIGRVEIRLNGSELTNNALEGKNVDPNLAEYDLTIKIPPDKLRVGKNSVEIITWNKADYFRSRKNEFPIYKDTNGKVRGAEVFEIPDKEKNTKPPNFFAIVAGVSDYVGDSLDLRFAAKDAEDMSLALALGARKLFCSKEITQKKPCEKVHIRLLSTEQEMSDSLLDIKDFQRLTPIKSNFQKAFTEVANQAKPEDIVVIYMAGHGNAITSPEATEKSAFPDLYLYATSEAKSIDAADLRIKSVREATTLSSLELADWMNKITADKKALILDTCAAGAVQEDLTAKVRAEDAEKVRALDRLRERTGFYVLMGSAADAVSYESNSYRQGLLTYSLLEAMTFNNKLRDGKFVDIQNWFANSVDRVEILAEGIGGIQKPRFFSSNFAKSFDVGEISREEQRKIPLAQPVPIILEPELREMGRRVDSAKLSEELTKKLREFSYTIKRGETSAINYVDAKNAVNGLSPRGEYKIEGNTVIVEIDLIQNETEFARIKFTTEKEKAIEKMLQEIVKAIQKNAKQ